MKTFLAIVGGLSLGLVLAIVVGIWWLKRKIRRFASELVEELGTEVAEPPMEITLAPERLASWSDAASAARHVDALTASGFSHVGFFAVPEMEGLRLQAFVNPLERAYGVVYEHSQAGVWMDVTSLADGASATFTSSAMAGDMDVKPGHVRVVDRECSPADLIRRFLTERPSIAYRAASSEAFVRDFERAYREEMEWRASRGLATEDEIRRVAERMGRGTDEDSILAVRSLYLQQRAGELDGAILQSYLESSNLTAQEWEAVRGRILIVTDMYSAVEIVERCAEELCSPDELEAIAPPNGELRGRDAMAEFNNSLPARLRLRLLGTTTEPVPADLYVVPDVMPSTPPSPT